MDSLLDEALSETHALLRGLDLDPAASELRIRVSLLARAARALSLRAPDREDVVRVARLLLDARDEVVAAHRRQALTHAVAEMMD